LTVGINTSRHLSPDYPRIAQNIVRYVEVYTRASTKKGERRGMLLKIKAKVNYPIQAVKKSYPFNKEEGFKKLRLKIREALWPMLEIATEDIEITLEETHDNSGTKEKMRETN
jgi:hypothetical protein